MKNTIYIKKYVATRYIYLTEKETKETFSTKEEACRYLRDNNLKIKRNEKDY